jgi:hypothetical protein
MADNSEMSDNCKVNPPISNYKKKVPKGADIRSEVSHQVTHGWKDIISKQDDLFSLYK